MTFSPLFLRIVSSLIMAPVALAAIFAGGWYFMAFVLAGLMISVYEWFQFSARMTRTAWHQTVGGLYLTFCFSSYIFLRFAFEEGAWLAISVIFCVWATDIGGYVMGRVIGGPKLAPKLSPKKTWAGLIGAMAFGGLALVGLYLCGEDISRIARLKTDLGLHPHHLPFLFAAGCLVGLIGQAGDLFISSYKREAGVKDTGALIPGHGGLLDRIDSLLLVAPCFLALVLIWHP
jgi:phosphatidate cytidylyltransferase